MCLRGLLLLLLLLLFSIVEVGEHGALIRVKVVQPKGCEDIFRELVGLGALDDKGEVYGDAFGVAFNYREDATGYGRRHDDQVHLEVVIGFVVLDRQRLPDDGRGVSGSCYKRSESRGRLCC